MNELEQQLKGVDLSTFKRNGKSIQINSRAVQDSTALANFISVPNINYISQGRYSMLESLGVTMNYVNPEVQIKYAKISDAEFVAEGAAISEGSLTDVTSTNGQGRIGLNIRISSEIMNESIRYKGMKSWLYDLIEKEIFRSLDRGLYKRVISLMEAETARTGWEAATADAYLTRAQLVDMEYDLSSVSEGGQIKLLMASDVKQYLKKTVEDSGSGRYLVQFGQMADIPAMSSTYVTSQYSVVADFKRSIAVNLPDEVDIIIDPITYGNTGEFRIVATMQANVDILDSTALIVLKNIAIA